MSMMHPDGPSVVLECPQEPVNWGGKCTFESCPLRRGVIMDPTTKQCCHPAARQKWADVMAKPVSHIFGHPFKEMADGTPVLKYKGVYNTCPLVDKATRGEMIGGTNFIMDSFGRVDFGNEPGPMNKPVTGPGELLLVDPLTGDTVGRVVPA